jgi:hypothetical protein
LLKDGRKRIISRCNILYTRKKDGKKKNSILPTQDKRGNNKTHRASTVIRIIRPQAVSMGITRFWIPGLGTEPVSKKKRHQPSLGYTFIT